MFQLHLTVTGSFDVIELINSCIKIQLYYLKHHSKKLDCEDSDISKRAGKSLIIFSEQLLIRSCAISEQGSVNRQSPHTNRK